MSYEKTHIFAAVHNQGSLSNPPNAHLRMEKSRRNGTKKQQKKETVYDAAEYLWFDRTFPVDANAQLMWKLQL